MATDASAIKLACCPKKKGRKFCVHGSAAARLDAWLTPPSRPPPPQRIAWPKLLRAALNTRPPNTSLMPCRQTFAPAQALDSVGSKKRPARSSLRQQNQRKKAGCCSLSTQFCDEDPLASAKQLRRRQCSKLGRPAKLCIPRAFHVLILKAKDQTTERHICIQTTLDLTLMLLCPAPCVFVCVARAE